MRKKLLIMFLLILGVGCSLQGEDAGMMVYHGASDSSAGFYVGGDRFVVADDENNMLRVYSCLAGGGPETVLDDLVGFLSAGGQSVEADIEGSAVAGDVVYWISSHGRNKNGKLRPGRQVFFATKFQSDSDGFRLSTVGVVYRRLLEDLIGSEVGQQLKLEKIVRLDDPSKKKLAPKIDGINIEGLTAGLDGKIYIGFRNPLFDGKALVVKLVNAAEVVQGDVSGKFEGPILLDLGKRGIRAMEYDSQRDTYYIIAGEKNAENKFSVYRWSGKEEDTPIEALKLTAVDKFNPEAMFIREGILYLLSDDGTVKVKVNSESECAAGELLPDGTCPNKFLVDPNARTFRVKKVSMKELEK